MAVLNLCGLRQSKMESRGRCQMDGFFCAGVQPFKGRRAFAFRPPQLDSDFVEPVGEIIDIDFLWIPIGYQYDAWALSHPVGGPAVGEPNFSQIYYILKMKFDRCSIQTCTYLPTLVTSNDRSMKKPPDGELSFLAPNIFDCIDEISASLCHYFRLLEKAYSSETTK